MNLASPELCILEIYISYQNKALNLKAAISSRNASQIAACSRNTQLSVRAMITDIFIIVEQ
jgi:hypothetical protein